MSGSAIRARLSQVDAGGAAGRDGGQTLISVAAVFLQVPRHQGLDGRSVVDVEVAQRNEVVGQRARLVEGPGLEGGDELALVDQTDLEGQHPEEQVTRGVGGAQHGGHLLK
jgi:hypothetical protein